MPVEQQPNSFRRCDRSLISASMKQFSDGWSANILAVRNGISSTHCIEVLRIEGPAAIDVRAIDVIRQDSVVSGIISSDDGSSIHNGRTRIDRMVIPKKHSSACQSPKRWSISFGYKVGTHPVPDDNDHVPPALCRCIWGDEASSQNCQEESRPNL